MASRRSQTQVQSSREHSVLDPLNEQSVTSNGEQGVALNTCPAASSISHDNSTFNPQSKPRPRAGVRGLDVRPK
jgi:hypothetical protein